MSSHKLRLRKTNLNLWISGLKEVVKVEDMFADFIQCLVNCAFPLTYPKQNMSIEHCKLSQKTYRKIRISSTRKFYILPRPKLTPEVRFSNGGQKSLGSIICLAQGSAQRSANVLAHLCPPRLQLF